MTFKIGDRVQVIYQRPGGTRPWSAEQLRYVGKCGYIASELGVDEAHPDQRVYHLVRFDDETEVGVAIWALRKLDEREDLQLVSWEDCLWRPRDWTPADRKARERIYECGNSKITKQENLR